MATEIRVPTLGESVSEATIGKWFKKAGEAVKADEPLVELETDKVTLEVNAPAAGVLAEITVKDGETVTPGALLGQISEGAPAPQRPPKSEAKAVAPSPASAQTQAPAASRAAAAATNGGSSAPSQSAPTQMPPAPSAAKIAAERGIDTTAVAGLRQTRAGPERRRARVLAAKRACTGPRPPPRPAPNARAVPAPTMRRAKSACA